MKTSEHLTIGQLYPRKGLEDQFQITDATINTGVFRPAGHDSVWLFVTEEKTADRTQYKDHLEGDDLEFEGQTEGRTDSLIVEHHDRGLELLLFHRLRKDEHADYAFRYEGPFVFVSAVGTRPTKFRLRRKLSATATTPSAKREMHYWAFACNPTIYDGLAACAQLEDIAWTVDRLDPRVGDMAIIWQGKGGNPDRGVVGLGEIIDGPVMMLEGDEERRFWKQAPTPGPARRCRLRLIEAPNLPLWESQQPELLGTLAVSRARGGTIFTLEERQWQRICELANAIPASPINLADAGQGWMADPRRRRAVERHAQDSAADHFRRLGFAVSDVSAHRPYDLLCFGADSELHVEVKGTTGVGDAVFLTRNEVNHVHRHPDHAVLAVMSQIVVDIRDGEVVANGGRLDIVRPWTIADEDLAPLQYRYRVRES